MAVVTKVTNEANLSLNFLCHKSIQTRISISFKSHRIIASIHNNDWWRLILQQCKSAMVVRCLGCYCRVVDAPSIVKMEKESIVWPPFWQVSGCVDVSAVIVAKSWSFSCLWEIEMMKPRETVFQLRHQFVQYFVNMLTDSPSALHRHRSDWACSLNQRHEGWPILPQAQKFFYFTSSLNVSYIDWMLRGDVLSTFSPARSGTRVDSGARGSRSRLCQLLRESHEDNGSCIKICPSSLT